ncbi:MAG: acetoacetate--CoA ligase [Desulfobacterales bacterium]
MAQKLWEPALERIQASNMFRFMDAVNQKHNLDLATYAELWEWSVTHIEDFWAEMWDFVGIQASRPFDQVVDDAAKMPGAHWFPGATLNFAENLLRYRDDQPALIFKGETQAPVTLSYRELYDQTSRLAQTLKQFGIEAGDRVAGFIPNMPQAVVAMLAAVSRGAIWSSCSPDFGIKGVLDRFGQIEPRILFVADGYFFKGKKIDSLERIAQIAQQIPSIEKVVVVPYTDPRPQIGAIPNAVLYDDFTAAEPRGEMEFVQLPAEHPLYIMYSSGTTGLPKCMVQSAGGILINQLKELLLHTDLKRQDTIFYFTTCGWMMWNWLICSLAAGARVVLFDGNPFHPDPSALWQMAQDLEISVFGTSAGYLAALENSGARPNQTFDLPHLRAILSTGSPLMPEQFDYVYSQIKADLQLASISGGSDLNGCFALGNPLDPVFRGELQGRGLGMKVAAFSQSGEALSGRQGELVCTAPFPSMPIYFWDDPDRRKYHKAYFDHFPNVWRHGDFITITEQGGVVIYGRSDATLNPGGVRIGTAEIYRQVENIEEVADSVVIGQSWQGDVRVVLFVVMKEDCELSEDLINRIKQAIRTNASPRHVPAKIIAVPGVPYTLNMKKVELAVKNIIEGRAITNRDALANPQVLEYFRDLPDLTS